MPAAGEKLRSAVCGPSGTSTESVIGILLGRHGGSLRVEQVEIVPCGYRVGPSYQLAAADLALLRRKASEIRNRGDRQILGYFRSCSRAVFIFEPADLDVIREIFPESRALVLAKHGTEGDCRVRVFQPDTRGGWSLSEETNIAPSAQAPLLLSAPAAEPTLPPEPLKLNGPFTLLSTPELSSDRRKQSARLVWVTLIAVLCLGAGAVFAWWMMLTPNGKDMALELEVVGSNARLTWNYMSPVVVSAKEGLLVIDDGGRRRRVHLDATQVSNGYVLYQPCSDDVTFRLEVEPASGRRVGESVRLLDALRSMGANGKAIDAAKVPVRLGSLRPKSATAGPATPRQFDPASLKPATLVEVTEAPVPTPKLSTEPPAKASVLQADSSQPPPPDASVSLPAGVVPPRPIRQTTPNPNHFARLSGSPATVIQIQVAVGVRGRVSSAHILSTRGPVSEPLLKEAVRAARRWVFEPAKASGRSVPGTHTILFQLQWSNG